MSMGSIGTAGPPLASLGSSVDRFLGAAQRFFEGFAEISWEYVVGALALMLVMQVARGHGWANAIRAAYPGTPVSERAIVGSFLVGVGMNGVLPARGGDAVKIVLAKRSIPGGTYPTVISSFAVLAPFDTVAAWLVLSYALTQGLLPAAPRLPNLPAFDISFWAANPEILALAVVGLAIAAVAAYVVGARHVEALWQRVKQGVAILSTPRRYLRQVALWQAFAWLCRFAAFWLFLEAFGIGGSPESVLLVFSVHSISLALPFTPGGAGAQQALLVAALSGPPRALVLSYSVGQQLAVTAAQLAVAFLALAVIFKTTGFRDLVREGREAQANARAGRRAPEVPPAEAKAGVGDPP